MLKHVFVYAVVGLVLALSSGSAYGQTDALTLDGVDDWASGVFDFEPTAFTVEAWVKVSSVTLSSSSGGSIVTYGRGNSQAFSMWLIPDAPGIEDSVSPRLQINFSNGQSRITPPVDEPVPFRVWTHIAMSYDNQVARVYIDGELVTQETWDIQLNPLPGGTLSIGREFPGVSEWLGGELDEVRIWSRVLTQGEIQGAMGLEVCTDAEDLFAYYPFNDDVGTDIVDTSGNGHDLMLLGGAMLVDAEAPVVPASGCVPCSPADIALPYGELNFFDVSAFIGSAPDLDGDGMFNFFDVSQFLSLYSMGCP